MTKLIANVLNDYLHLAAESYGYKYTISLIYSDGNSRYELFFSSKNGSNTYLFYPGSNDLENKKCTWELFKTVGFGLEMMRGMKQGFDELLKSNDEIKDTSVQINGCPKCKSAWVVKNGTRKNINGPVNRYKCNSCHYRFTMSEDSET